MILSIFRGSKYAQIPAKKPDKADGTDLFPSPLVGEGGAQRRMRGEADDIVNLLCL